MAGVFVLWKKQTVAFITRGMCHRTLRKKNFYIPQQQHRAICKVHCQKHRQHQHSTDVVWLLLSFVVYLRYEENRTNNKPGG